MTKSFTDKKLDWEDEYVDLYGYLDKYVKGIVGRQGKWFAQKLAQARQDQKREILRRLPNKKSYASLKEIGKETYPDEITNFNQALTQIKKIINQI